MNSLTRKLTWLGLLVFSLTTLPAQTDDTFWFAVPEITQGTVNYDRPTMLRISTVNFPANITVSMPAEPAFPPQIISLAAQSSGVVDLEPWIDLLENKPPNTVLNKGLKIQASNAITAYYEVLGQPQSNPEIFALKGRNALGTSFVIPLQNLFGNSPSHFPLPHAAFDIVATEDNTQVTITPTRPLVGHAAGVPFTVTLDAGQTYSAESLGQQPDDHPTGSIVTATKPIAITIKDDLLGASPTFPGDCRDLIGDQLVPTDKIGRQYVVQKGSLNGVEKTFVVGTAANTQISVDGVPVTTIGIGQTYVVNVSGKHFIEGSAPIYVLQLTGIGCEFSGVLLPSLECNGSSRVRFVRSTNERFYLFVVTRAGNEGGFALNGNSALVPASAFTAVPGSGGQYVATVIDLSFTPGLTAGTSLVLTNSIGEFQMGFLNGLPNATGSRMGYFSNFGRAIPVDEFYQLCAGDSLSVHGLTLTEPGVYFDTTMTPSGCDTVFRIQVDQLPAAQGSSIIALCPGETFIQAGTAYTAPDTVAITLTAANGCDSVVTYTLVALPQPTRTESVVRCAGESFLLGGVAYTQNGSVLDTVAATGGGCDTIVTYVLTFLPAASDTVPVERCDGESFTLGGVVYTANAILTDTLTAANGCDSVVVYQLTFTPLPTRTEALSFCAGDVFSVNGIDYTTDAAVLDTLPATAPGCDTVVTYQLTFTPLPTRTEALSFCAGDVFSVNGIDYTTDAAVLDTLPATAPGCDTVVTYQLTFAPLPTRTEALSFCAGDVFSINGIDYTTDAAVLDTLPATAPGCDTVVTYQLTFAPLPTRTEAVALCQGDVFSVNGIDYSADAAVLDTLPATAPGCDTVVTYQLTFAPLPTRTEAVALCQGDVFTIDGVGYASDTTVQSLLPATAPACDTAVTYQLTFAPLPVRSETFVLQPGETIDLGGSLYSAPDTVILIAAATAPACDTVVTYYLLPEETACDVKTIGCMKYELLTIQLDADGNKTYRVRVTNYCANNELVYTAIQVPQGTAAVEPANGSTYTAPSGRTYTVRNPNFAPTYSIRFKSQGPGIKNGQSDIFEYTIDEVSQPDFIYIVSRLSPDAPFTQEAHLNTFFCPILPYDPAALRPAEERRAPAQGGMLHVYPNPATDLLIVEFDAAAEMPERLRVRNAQGQTLLTVPTGGQSRIQLELPATMPAGLYILETLSTTGNSLASSRFLLIR